jgi:uncharacterized membrane protein YkgB
MTWSIEGFRGFLMEGLSFGAVLPTIGALLLLDIIFIAIGVFLFRKAERYVKSRGALSQF